MRISASVLATRFLRPSSVKANASNLAASPTFVREHRQWMGRMSSRSGSALPNEIKQEAERRQTQLLNVRTPTCILRRLRGRTEEGARRAHRRQVHASLRTPNPQSAHACRRSTAVLARGTAHPRGSASGHASWDLAGAFDPHGRPNRGSGDLAPLHGYYPRRNLSQSSEAPRAPVIVPAGLMPKPPECDSDEPPPAGTALAPPDGVTA
jgi:hypothetical protein